MKLSFRILGTGSSGEGCPSVVCFTDRRRYLINCGEGTQRMCVEHKEKLSKIDHVLLTRLNWDYTGGLPGAILTGADSGMDHLQLTGPRSTRRLVASLRAFVYRSDLRLTVCEPATVEDDGVLTIRPIELLLPHEAPYVRASASSRFASPPSSADLTGGSTRSQETSIQDDPDHPHRTHMVLQTTYDPRNERDLPDLGMPPPFEPLDEPSSSVLCYTLALPDAPGRFDVARASAKGVPPGPLCGKLVRGESVTLADGTVVHPSDCLGPSRAGPTAAIVDCPEGYIDALVTHSAWDEWKVGRTEKRFATMLHLSERAVLEDPRYRAWTASFGPDVLHVLLHGSVTPSPFQYASAAANHLRCRMLRPDLFPSLYSSHSVTGNASDFLDGGNLNLRVILGEPMLSVDLRAGESSATVLRDRIPLALDEDALRKELVLDPVCATLFEQASSSKLNLSSSSSSVHSSEKKGEDPFRVLFTGTGAMLPSKYRNVSGIHIRRVCDDAAFLFDCGEGTYGQLHRRFGPDGIDAHMRQLHGLLVTHVHADHHLGLLRLLRARKAAGATEPVLLVAPLSIKRFLDEYRSIERLPFVYLRCSDAADESFSADGDVARALRRCGIRSLRAVPVVHCTNAYGFVVDLEDGSRIVYSGDTRPCKALAEAGRDASLLIHEATFEDALAESAFLRRHSTVAEALRVAEDMRAKFTVLAHFSQRYPKVPVLPDGLSVAVALDHLEFAPSTYSQAKDLLPILASLFPSDD